MHIIHILYISSECTDIQIDRKIWDGGNWEN